MTSTTGSPSRRGAAKDIARVACGNFLEMYDFMVFGYFAAAIGAAYFPKANPTTAILGALAAFGVGFLMRPLGAIVLGAYTDRVGRRKGLLTTLTIMSIGIIIIAFCPTYAAIGITATILVVLGRLLQGFSAGAEPGSVSAYLAEMAPPGRRGFYVSWHSASQQMAVMAAAGAGIVTGQMLDPVALESWGWRLPLILGCLMVPFLFFLRRNLRESVGFAAPRVPLTFGKICQTLWVGRRAVVSGVALLMMTTVSFYMITAYTPTFGKLLNLPEQATLFVTAGVGLSNLIWLPIMGALSDRIGRKPIMIACTILAIVTAYPVMSWLTASPAIWKLIVVELWLSLLYASYNGALIVHLTETVPAAVRASGVSLAFSLAQVIGGFTPLIATALIAETGNFAMPGAWLTVAASISLIATLLLGGGGTSFDDSKPTAV